jgi:hypothetical protein
MSDFANVVTRSVTSAADQRTRQYTIQRAAAAGTCDISSNAAASHLLGPIGVLINKPNTGQAATIAYAGEVKVVAGGTVTANALVTNNASGRAANATSGQMVIGRALETATTDGEVVRMQLMSPTAMVRT